MRVRMKSLMAGPAGVAQPGQVIDLAAAEAYDLIERGYAEQVDDPAAVERAIAPPPESADLPRRRGPRR